MPDNTENYFITGILVFVVVWIIVIGYVIKMA